MVIKRRKRSQILNDVKPVKNINKNLQSLKGIGHGLKEGTSQTAILCVWVTESFEIKGR